LFFVADFGGEDGIAFDDGAHLYLARQFLYLCVFAGDVPAIDETLKFQQNQLVLHVLGHLIGDELVIDSGRSILFVVLGGELLCYGGQLGLVGGGDG
jgi:hypothetical protein